MEYKRGDDGLKTNESTFRQKKKLKLMDSFFFRLTQDFGRRYW